MHDGLTGLLNRAALEEQARGLWQHATAWRGCRCRSLLIDIDHFKAYNDRYGHQAGDRLPAAGRQRDPHAARSAGRWTWWRATAARKSSPFCSAPIAPTPPQRRGAVLKAVTELGIAHGGSATRPYVTVSVGVTTVEPGGDYSHDHAVRQADIALYSSKARGRDGWSCHEPAEPARIARWSC